MRFIFAIMALFCALNLSAQTASKAPTVQNIFSKDVSAMRHKPTATATEEGFLSKEQTRLAKHEQTVTKASSEGKDIYHEGKIVYLVPTKSTKNGFDTVWYDRPCIVVQKTSASGSTYYAWKTVPKADWNVLTGKQTSK